MLLNPEWFPSHPVRRTCLQLLRLSAIRQYTRIASVSSMYLCDISEILRTTFLPHNTMPLAHARTQSDATHTSHTSGCRMARRCACGGDRWRQVCPWSASRGSARTAETYRTALRNSFEVARRYHARSTPTCPLGRYS